MEFLFMIAGIITSIVLAFVGILKTPLLRFKAKKWFKPILTFITIIVMTGASVLAQIYILEKPLFCMDFAILVVMVFAGVFFGYNGIYEGFKIKDLLKTLFNNIKNAKKASPESKFAKAVNKLSEKYKVPIQKVFPLVQAPQATHTAQTTASPRPTFLKR